MSRSKICILIYSLASITLILCASRTKGDALKPHLDTDFSILNIPGQILDAQLSRQGDIVVGRTGTLTEQIGGGYVYTPSSLYLWFVAPHDNSKPSNFLQPSGKWEVSPGDFPVFAISPDEHYLAVRTTTELQLLSLPDLKLVTSVSAYGSTDVVGGIVGWSEDSQLIGSLLGLGEEFKVWDIVTGAQYSYTIKTPLPRHDWQQPTLVSLTNGWLVKNFYTDTSIGFIYCDYHLEKCVPYNYENTVEVANTLDGKTVLTEGVNSIGIWKLRDDGTYGLDDLTLTTKETICPNYFSPSGQYLYSRCSQIGNIWEFSTLIQLNKLVDYQRPSWFPNEEFFVTMRPDLMLKLYQLGQDKPIQELDLSTAKAINLRELVESDLVNIEGISQDGTKVLVGVGGAAIIIPVTYIK